MISFKHRYIFILVHKMNHASVVHKITVFKEQNRQKMVLLKIVLEFLTSAEPLRLTQRTPGVRSNPG